MGRAKENGNILLIMVSKDTAPDWVQSKRRISSFVYNEKTGEWEGSGHLSDLPGDSEFFGVKDYFQDTENRWLSQLENPVKVTQGSLDSTLHSLLAAHA